MNAEQRSLLLQVIETVGSIEGVTDTDDARIRCVRRTIAEVLGLPLDRFPLLKESQPRKPIFYSQYSPVSEKGDEK